MTIRGRLLPDRILRLPRRTIRLRLTIVYAMLFLASGAGLLATTYVLVREATGGVLVGSRGDGSSFVVNNQKAPKSAPKGKGLEMNSSGQPGSEQQPTPEQLQAQLRRDEALAQRQHDAEMRLLLEKSGIALALMAAVSILLGWLAAGRALRPVRTLNERARAISASDLHKRLALAGPDDELKQLADSFDDLLDRLEAAFAAQRQFVANASHELRSPLARAQTLAEIALGDPDATVDSLRASHRRALAAGQQQERLIEALLTLARSERGLDHREPFDLAAITTRLITATRPDAKRSGVELHAALEPAETSGDPRLAERLIANLIDNGIRHNQPAGHVEIRTTTTAGQAVLSISNSGPPVAEDELERLFQPFQRLRAARTTHGDGLGLGLSIVKAIATAHGATLAARPAPDGGLQIEISFPAAGAAGGHQSEGALTAGAAPPRRLLRRSPLSLDDIPAEAAPSR